MSRVRKWLGHLVLAAILVALPLGAAQPQRSGVSIDVYHLDVAQSVNADTKGVAFSSNGQTVSPAVRNLVLILSGQSLCADIVPSAYVPANPTKIDQLNIYDGAIRVASDPILGTSWPRVAGVPVNGVGNAYLRLADLFITNGKFDRVILVPTCLGATAVADWAPGGFLQDTFAVTMRRLAANGIVAGTNVTIAGIWAQGETDTLRGTGQSPYQTSLSGFITASRTAGFNGIWFVNIESRNVGVTSANVTNAQAAVVNHGSGIWAGANADALAGSVCSGQPCRQPDDTHWSDAGAASIAAATYTAMGLAGAPFSFLMKRDLHPSNDNDHTPVFINKAA